MNSFAEYAPELDPETKKKDVDWFALIPGKRFEGVVHSIGPGLSESPFDPGPPLFRELILSIPKEHALTAIGLRVSLQLPGCGS
jgi:hypothetical protein